MVSRPPPSEHSVKDYISNEHVLQQFPFWALVSFGSYLLFKLGWGVVTFNDVPDAYRELMGEIEVAKRELRESGVDVG